MVNVRHPDLVLGDTRAQIGTTRVGAERVAQLVKRYGLPSMRAAFDELIRLCERRIRAALSPGRMGPLRPRDTPTTMGCGSKSP